MKTYVEVSKTRIPLKMKLSVYSWYKSSFIAYEKNEGYFIIINVSKLDNNIRKLVPQIIDGVSIKVESL